MLKKRYVSALFWMGALATLGLGQDAPLASDRVSGRDLEGRVKELLSSMTIEEKIGQLNQLFYGAKTPDE